MYIPSTFAVTDLDQLHDFIEQHSFGTLVTHDAQGSMASHVPFHLQRKHGRYGTLSGHLARANTQWKSPLSSDPLVIFSGPHAYISPAWYQAELTVPTWNYIAVHASGPIRWIDDRGQLLEIVKQAVATYERSRPDPWQLIAPDDFIDRMLQQIVGFEIEITRLEGKWKLSQNQPDERREKVRRALEAMPGENAQAIARAMRR